MHIPALKEGFLNSDLVFVEYEMQGHQSSPRTALHSPCLEFVSMASNMTVFQSRWDDQRNVPADFASWDLHSAGIQ